jgi:hypothetical protein
MMKLMKFMVTLILMPIGTFFGALLRPILIMLLRKFIVPFYSTMMPTLMNLGTQVGNAIVMFLDDPVKYLKDLIFPEEDREFGDPPKNEEELKNMGILDILATWANGWDPNNPFGLSAYADTEGNLKVAIKSGLIDSNGNTIYKPEDIEKGAPDAGMNKTEDQEPLDVEAELAGGKRQPDGSILLPNGDIIVDGVTYKNADKSSSSSTNNNTWGNGEGLPEYVNPVTAPETTELTENQKDMQLMMNDPQAWQAKQDKIKADKKKAQQEKWMLEAEEKALKQKQDEENKARLAAALAKPSQSTGADRMAAQAARNAQQETVNTENTRFAGTPSAGKLSRSLNAGANVGAAMDKNASKGHVNLSTSNMNLSQATRDLLASMNSGIIPAAEGFDGMVNSPTLFMAGESGAEHVKVTPSGQGGGGNITVNIQNMNGSDDDLRKLKKTILEVIQQSANNRGRL